MKFTQWDVETVAKARVAKAESKKTNKWVWGMVVGILIGFLLLWKVNIGIGYGVAIVSVVAFLYYTSKLSKKQNLYKAKLLMEWQNENKEVK